MPPYFPHPNASGNTLSPPDQFVQRQLRCLPTGIERSQARPVPKAVLCGTGLNDADRQIAIVGISRVLRENHAYRRGCREKKARTPIRLGPAVHAVSAHQSAAECRVQKGMSRKESKETQDLEARTSQSAAKRGSLSYKFR